MNIDNYGIIIILLLDVVSSQVTAKEGASQDYPAIAHSLTFAASDGPRETVMSFDITVIDDNNVEFPEYFELRLTNVNGANIGEPNTADVLINDNDG